jgi:hypothetical protein
MPAVGSTVSGVTFNSTANFNVGMTLYFATGATATACFMEVTTLSDATHLVLTNRGYASNPAATTTIPTSLAFSASPAIVSGTFCGLVPALPNDATQVLLGNGSFAQLAYTSITGTPIVQAGVNLTSSFTQPAVGSTVTVNVTDSTFAGVGRGVMVPSGGYYTVTANATGTITMVNNGHAYNRAAGVNIGGSVIAASACNLFSSTNAGDVPLSGGGTTNFLRADGTWAAPVGNVPSTRLVATQWSLTGGGDLSVDRTHNLVGDVASPGNWQIYSTNASGTRGWNASTAFPQATATVAGLVPTPPNNTDQWLRGDATWVQSPPLAKTTALFNWPASTGTVAVTVDSTSLMMVGTGLYFPALGLAEVTAVGSSTSVTIRNNGNSGNAGASSNIAVGTSIFSSGAGALATATTTGAIPVPPNNTTTFLRGDATFATPPTATATTAGYVSPPNNTQQWLRGDATWTRTFDSKTYGRFRPYDNIPYSTTYPTFNTRGALGLPTLDCPHPGTTDCLFSDIMPENASLGSGLITNIKWTAHTATTGNVRWQVQFQRLNASIATASFDTAGLATTTTSGTVDTIATTSITLTTISGVTAGDLYVVKVSRLGSDAADTMTDTAQVVSVEVRSAI